MRAFILIFISLLLFAFSFWQQGKQPLGAKTAETETIQARLNRILDQIQLELITPKTSWSDIPESLLNRGVNVIKVKEGNILEWKDHAIVADIRMLGTLDRWTYFKNPSFDYLSRIYIDVDDNVLAVIVLLKKDYKISNRYLSPFSNAEIFDRDNVQILFPSSEDGAIYYRSDLLFNVLLPSSVASEEYNNYLLYIVLLAIVLFSSGILFLINQLIRKRQFGFAVLSLFILIVLLRALLLWIRFPAAFIDHPVTNPAYFASSWISPSMIDLLLNAFLLLILVYTLFGFYTRLKVLRDLYFAPVWVKILSVTALFALILFSFLLIWVSYQSIYHNSAISFDITDSIRFDLLRVLAFLGIVLISAVFFFLTHIVIQVSRLALKSRTLRSVSWLLALVIFVVINVYNKQFYFTPLLIVVIYLIIVNLLNLYKTASKISFMSFVYFFTMAFCSSLVGTFAIIHFEAEEQSSMQRKFANEFLLERDDLAEFLLYEARPKIANDLFIQSRLSSPFLSKETIKQKIKQVYLSRYFDKYNVDVKLFSSNGVSYDQRNIEGLPDLLSRIQEDTQRTGYNNIYFISDAGRDIFKRYFTLIPIERHGTLTGFVVLDLSLKRIIPDNVYPELLVDTRFLQPYRDRNFSFALFENEKVQYTSGDFNYWTTIVQELFSRTETNRGVNYEKYLHSLVEDEGGRIAIVSSRWNYMEKVTAGFSFLFLLHLAIILLLIVVYGLYSLITGSRLNYSARIQFYLNLAFFLPLIIMSITVLGLMSTSFREEQNEDFLERARNLAIRIQQVLDERDESSESEELFQHVAEVASLANVELNIFDVSGKLYLSSQPQIYESHIQSIYLNPKAKSDIIDKAMQSVVIEERLGRLQFYNAYAALRSAGSGELLGVLSIPSYDSGYLIERARITVLANIMNVFTLLFFLFLLISFFTSKWLTFPLRFITQKLRRTTLTGQNQPLAWAAQDEIGLMVSEYNRMLKNLELSKTQLERSQLEAAWREIAQQVAHEIKNPLTPMKLTLQHLQHTLTTGEFDKQKYERSLDALLKEVDTLNGIASSFSTFAKMPKPIQTRLDLSMIVNNTAELYSSQGFSDIRIDELVQEAYIMADEQLLSRIVSNLVLNAIQAASDDETISVRLSLIRKGKEYVLSIKDNGRGISDEMKNKIFLPRFTTKQSGSGIGLAIVKQGVEYFNGKVWFESTSSKGTIFYISFPVA